ncbi:MAG: 2-isopropylmalate synthase [Candidatus Schekmanbacteria bacterium]|nr:2-isopropylmalate synthase [Candidatus Schekmanbacteria bacterium]
MSRTDYDRSPVEQDLVFDWNLEQGMEHPSGRRVEFNDESLRDGLQSPSIIDPPITDKLRMLHLMEALSIDGADIGLPGAGPRAYADALRLAQEISSQRMRIFPNCAARTVVADIAPIAEISQKAGLPIQVATFIGSSPIRQYAEDWDLGSMLRRSEEAIGFAVRESLPVMFVTEDTTRARPETLKTLYGAAIAAGASRLCLCDTVGHATPEGAANLVRFVRDEIVAPLGRDLPLDWHGHRDRGLALSNAIAAWEAGASRLHGTALGIGERVGNCELELLLVHFKLIGVNQSNLERLVEYVETAARACGVPIPVGTPVVGADAFRTATGVHAAAIIKAMKKGDRWLADSVYSGVPASLVGREQIIEIGPMSGESNAVYWLSRRGIQPTPERVKAIMERAKQSSRILTDEQVHQSIAASGVVS